MSISDLDLKKWRKYKDILTDSLWIVDKRDKSGFHKADYHGNFIPQIPKQLIKRFTKKGDVVLDTFLGSGTTLIECKSLERSGIGIELLKDVAKIAKDRIVNSNFTKVPQDGHKACRPAGREYVSCFLDIVISDSTKEPARKRVDEVLKVHDRKGVQLLIMHPPYHDIIKFSKKKGDLSNAESVEKFVELFGKTLSNYLDLLEKKHYLAVIIGDKYTKKEWVPLGFFLMQEVLKNEELKLKSIVVKNMSNNRAKRNLERLWRYRALRGGFYVFKHEYILLFQKIK